MDSYIVVTRTSLLEQGKSIPYCPIKCEAFTCNYCKGIVKTSVDWVNRTWMIKGVVSYWRSDLQQWVPFEE